MLAVFVSNMVLNRNNSCFSDAGEPIVLTNPVGGRNITIPQLEKQEERPFLDHEAVYRLKTFLGLSKNKTLKLIRLLKGKYF